VDTDASSIPCVSTGFTSFAFVECCLSPWEELTGSRKELVSLLTGNTITVPTVRTDTTQKTLERTAIMWGDIEKEKDEAQAAINLLPSEEDLQLLQRYEVHLNKLFMETLHELQQVQSFRLGRKLPSLMAQDGEENPANGFVS
tara:strand:- start:898 stop:1326 length:429 start_codon:yes stop_codon:yes gene_type:complete